MVKCVSKSVNRNSFNSYCTISQTDDIKTVSQPWLNTSVVAYKTLLYLWETLMRSKRILDHLEKVCRKFYFAKLFIREPCGPDDQGVGLKIHIACECWTLWWAPLWKTLCRWCGSVIFLSLSSGLGWLNIVSSKFESREFSLDRGSIAAPSKGVYVSLGLVSQTSCSLV